MNRNNYIDYAKALCIVFLVYIHTGFSAINNIILFAVPTFFAVTGYTFSFGKRSFSQNIVCRFKSIMIPYFWLMLLFAFIEAIRAKLFGYGGVSIVYASLLNTVYGSGICPFGGGIFDKIKEIMSYKAQPQMGVDLILPLNCHLWFLPATFVGYAIFSAVVKVTRRSHFMKAVIIVCLLLVASLEVVFPQVCQLPFGIGRGAIGATFMLFGFWLKDYKLIDNKSVKYYILTNILAIAIYAGAIYVGSDGSAMVRSYYGPYGVLSVFATFVGGVAGVWIALSICKLIEKLPLEKLKNLLSYAGKNVMTIYVWHMIFKFLLDAFYVCIIKKPDFSMLDEYKMGLIPQNSMYFMLFEGIVAIALCLLCSIALNKLKSVEKSKKV